MSKTSSDASQENDNLGDRMVRSGAVLTSARLVNRIFSLVRVLTIARWLGPEMMGVYGVATLVLAAIERFSATGFPQSLIQKQGDISPYVLPVRTLQAVRGLFIGLLLLGSAPWIADFFDSPESLNILRAVSLLPIINGLEPLFLILSQKEMRFGRMVALQAGASFAGLLVGLVAAYFRPDAWSLVWASLTVAIVITIGGHILSPRHNLGFTIRWRPLKEIFPFGMWMLAISTLAYLFTRGGEWMIGYVLDVKSLALYQMAFLICTLATFEIGSVISQLSFPLFSRLQDDPERLKLAFRKSFGFASVITMAAAGLVIVCASDLFRLVLGEDWTPALPLVPWLTVWGVCSMFVGPQSAIFKAMNRLKTWALTVACMTAMMAVGLYPMTRHLGMEGAAILMAGIGVTMQLIRYRIMSSLLHMSYGDVLRHVLVPTASVILASVLTIQIRQLLPESSLVLGFALSMNLFLAAYLLLLGLGARWLEPSPWELLSRLGGMFRRSRSHESGGI